MVYIEAALMSAESTHLGFATPYTALTIPHFKMRPSSRAIFTLSFFTISRTQNASIPLLNNTSATLVPAGSSNYSGNIPPIPWTTRPEVYGHSGNTVRYHRARLNQVRIHYYVAGSGPPLLLIHGTPKTNYYWYKLVPLLTPHFTVMAPDLRGFGYTGKLAAAMGYDSRTNAIDLAGLITILGFEQFHVHGEDRGAEFAYAVAGIYRDRVLFLSFCEMLLSGVSLDKWSYFTPENIPFFYYPNAAEMLIAGKEEELWSFFMESECYNPMSISRQAIAKWISSAKGPGGLRGILETYRADMSSSRTNGRSPIPVMTVGAPEFFGVNIRNEMLMVAESAQRSVIFEECGYSLVLEAEVSLAVMLIDFMVG
ncbi:alpha/beta-hydrolase [Lentithecium fluviatile CBS 122367]|uniref:Alpha/beta-hydrolase n=1 Tax=Lentithecium fluviatile CBS 122367 TaxID=1168545 RepID=A0A6G1ISQ9_9PLEO|nr:alpha/beta-hydrolase [Lentithecium fluviatile CBS 122367]